MLEEEIVADYYSIAKVAYQANKAFSETNFDFTHKDWDDISDEAKTSFVNGVIRVFEKPDITPEEIHENWKKEKVDNGWVYGEEKDIEKKTHPCISIYDNLPLFEKLKDKLFIDIVKVFV